MQLYPHALSFAAPQRESGVADAYDERVPTRACFGEDLYLLTIHEAKLEQAPLECRQRVCARAHTDHTAFGARRQSRKADKARLEANPGWCGDCIHACQYE